MAMLFISTGHLDKSHYYMGRLYELEGYNDISTAFYKKAVEMNPHSEAAERLNRRQSVLPTIHCDLISLHFTVSSPSG
jgi:hypothetical protein